MNFHLMSYLLISSAEASSKGATFWMPPQYSTLAEEVDYTFYFIYWVCVVFFFLLMGGMFYLAVKYKKRSDNDRTLDIKGSHTLEFVWSVFPTFLLLAMFVLGFKTYIRSTIPPADSMEVRVIGKQWDWRYVYPDTGIESSVLKVPKGKAIRLTMYSEDVLHSFYVPDFRVKKDVLPNRYTVLWFQTNDIIEPRADKGGIYGLNEETNKTEIITGLGAGEHQVFCTEYCGDSHSRMLSKVQVMEPADYEKWVKAELNFDPSTLSLPERGKWLYKKRACVGCHSLDGSKGSGPTWKGLYGAQRTFVEGGGGVADDNYIKESIIAPAAKIVTGYQNQMPGNYRDLLTDEEIGALIEFMKTLK